MYRLVYRMVHLFLENYSGLHVSDFFDLISGSGSPRQGFSSKNTHKINGGVPVLTAVRSEAIGDDFFFFSTVPRGVGLHHLQVFILMSFTHFLELRDAERLCVSTRDLADATRGKIVVIEASRVLYARIFVYGVPHVITQRCVRARSLTRLDRLRRFLSISECP